MIENHWSPPFQIHYTTFCLPSISNKLFQSLQLYQILDGPSPFNKAVGHTIVDDKKGNFVETKIVTYILFKTFRWNIAN